MGAVLTGALAICGVYAGSAVAGEEVVALPTVHVVTKAIRFHHKRALLVKAITVSNIDGALRVSCDRCLRYSTKIHETHPTPTTQVLSGVSWIIILGRDIQIAVSNRRQTGRFVLLGAGSHNTLAFKASGCLFNEGGSPCELSTSCSDGACGKHRPGREPHGIVEA